MQLWCVTLGREDGWRLSVNSCLLEYIDIPHLLASWHISWTPSDSLNSVTNGPSYSFASLPSFRLGKNYLIWVHVPLSWSSTAQLYTGARAHRIVAAHLHISYLYSYFIFIFIFFFIFLFAWKFEPCLLDVWVTALIVLKPFAYDVLENGLEQ